MPSFQDLKDQRAARHRPSGSNQAGPSKPRLATSSGAEYSGTAGEAMSLPSTISELPDGVVLRRDAVRGRGLYARQSISKGSKVLTTPPTVAVLSVQQLSSCCSSCHLSPQEVFVLTGKRCTMKRCTACRVLHYCSPTCQMNDWPKHREECAAHKRMRTMFKERYPQANTTEDTRWVMREPLRALGRLFWARRRARRETTKDPIWWEAVARMESHVGTASEKATMSFAGQVQQLQYYLGAAEAVYGEPQPVNMEDYGFSSMTELLKLCSAFQLNSFTLSTPSLSPIGVAMSPTMALCNHSCEPNAVVVFPKGAGSGMDLVAIRDIEAGEEILTSYVDVSLPVVERQKALKERYGFTCVCKLCQKVSDKPWMDPRNAITHSTCKKGKGKGKLPQSPAGPSTCTMCGEAFLADLRELPKLQSQAEVLLLSEEKGSLGESRLRPEHDTSADTILIDPQRALRQLSTLIPALFQLVPPSSHPLLALLRLRALLLSSSTDAAQRDLAVSSLALAHEGAQAVYPPGHPTLAIILSECGKLLSLEPGDGTEVIPVNAVVSRLTQAVLVLQKAVQACELGFGPGGGIVGLEMRGLLQGCQGELGIIRANTHRSS